jgi:hypothetical protein
MISRADVAQSVEHSLGKRCGSGDSRDTHEGCRRTSPAGTLESRGFRFKADVAQSVEHSLGKGEVVGSIPIISSRFLEVVWPARRV